MLENMEFEHVEIVGRGSVYQTKSGKQTMGFAFYYRVKGGDKKRKVVNGCDREELEKKAVDFINKIEAQYRTEQETIRKAAEEILKPKTLGEVGDLWFEKYQKGRYRKKKPLTYSSIESRKLSLKKIKQVAGDILLDDITQDVAEEIIDNCCVQPDGTFYSKSYMGKLEQVFQLIVKFGRQNGYGGHELNKVILDEALPQMRPEERFLDKEEIKKIIEIVGDNERYLIVVKMLCAMGLRQEELFALTVDDFTVDKNGEFVEVRICKAVVENEDNVYTIENRTKTYNSNRTVYLPCPIYKDLMRYYHSVVDAESMEDKLLRKANGTEGVIFVNKDKKVINKRTFRRNFRQYMERKGIKDFDLNVTLHMFRHSYASFMSETQAVQKVAKVLGDSIETTYKNYYSLTNSDKEKIVDSISSTYDGIF